MKRPATPRRPAKGRSSKEKTAPPAAPGLRARKRQETREKLTRAAMALFLERGFEATTLDDIVAAADISRRTFFHYFASKEDVVFAWQEEASAALIAAVAARPAGESMLAAAENAIIAMAGQLDPAEVVALARLKQDNPALQARDQLKYEKLERTLADALLKRTGNKTDKMQARLVAMIATGAMRVGGELWAAEGARETPELLARRMFAAIRAMFE
ncbi:TetR family transcriptional regulator [Bradyrhizobium sp. 31Argb]|uniref:TetR family transcriptional regulator n=1 Tax=unclassified Bradyrhizobium TaxID=2631580 RepID=UPI001FE0BBF3|nr:MULTISPECIES: TetR family transcriptional regulator [unclassified Bradyrhizobium]MDI4238984.1 TetR family transcriptional regulator [Bradyrhizobium sp. Arg237L]